MIALPTITIKCGEPDCDNGLHAYNDQDYQRLGQGRNYLRAGICKCCGDSGVDFGRTHMRDEADLEYLVSSLLREKIRHIFWNRPFNDASLARACALGRSATYAGIAKELERIVGPVAEAHWAFKQVPTDQNKMREVVQYAQHAMAACCRRCIHKWHGIPNNAPLTQDQIRYLSRLVRYYLDQRLPSTIAP